MGIVFRAVSATDGGVVAIKVLRDELGDDETFRRRFAHEVRAAQSVHHPNLVPVLTAGEVNGRPYLVMRCVLGVSLAAQLERGPLSIPEAVKLVQGVAAGLDTLHAAGIVHRDVKPANILLDESGNVALTDFGLAKGRAYSVLTARGQVIGTVDYLAPERIRGTVAAPPSDIYSLGCVAFAALTGRPPFAGRPANQVARAHLQEDPPDPCEGRPHIPSALRWALLRALAKEASRRPRTAGHFGELMALAIQDPADVRGRLDR